MAGYPGDGSPAGQERAPYPLAPEDPRQVGPYRTLGRLGAGGMGVVYLVRTPSGGVAALKVVGPGLASQPEFRDLFVREVRTVARLRCRFTARVLDSDLDSPRPWVVSEYISGPTLADRISHRGPLRPDELLHFAARLAQALAEIHAAGTIHRDIKPANVILAADGPRIIDFGIAHTTDGSHSPAKLGSKAWAAPEQVLDQPLSGAVDVFSWGLVVAKASTGQHPFGQGSPTEIAHRIAHEEPDLSAVPILIREHVAAALKRQPADRIDPRALQERLDSSLARRRHGAGWQEPPPAETETSDIGALRASADAAFNQARSSGDEGDWAAARAELAVLERELAQWAGQSHAHTIDARKRLAYASGRTGDWEHARLQYESIVDHCEVEFGSHDRRTLQHRESLAIAAYKSGDYRAAEELLERLAADRLHALGASDKGTLSARYLLALTHGRMGRWEEARDELDELLGHLRETHPPNEPLALRTQLKLALATGEAGDWPGARQLLRTSVATHRVQLGINDHRTLQAEEQLALAAGRDGDWEESRELLAQVVKDLERTRGIAHPSALAARRELALAVGEAGDWDAARTMLRQLVDDLADVRGPRHRQTLLARYALTRATGETGDHARALRMGVRLRPEMERTLGSDHADSSSLRRLLVAWRIKAAAQRFREWARTG